jgi:ABC-type sugar transport system substrate-binding protein
MEINRDGFRRKYRMVSGTRWPAGAGNFGGRRDSKEKGMKKGFAVLLTAAMAASLAACGGSSSSGGTSDSTSSSSAASSATESAASTSSAASSSAGGEDYTPAKDSYKIDVVLKTLSAEYWQYVEAGCNAYASDHPGVQVDVKGPTSETAFDEQTNMLTTDLAVDYDAYVIAPLQSDSVAQVMKDAKAPVLAVDTNINADYIASFVGTGNENAAASGGKAAVQMAKDLGWDEIKCIEIAGVQGDETCTARMNGYKKGVNEAGGEFLENEVQYADATADKAVAAMEGIMSTHPEGIAIVAANNDDMAMAAARTAAGNEAYKNTVFLGFNGDKSACQAMADGTYSNYISVAQEAYGMGYKAVEAAVKAADGVKLDRFTDSGSEIITKDNAQERLDTLASYLS